MKRLLSLLLTFIFLFSTALAETDFDLSGYSTAELRELSIAAHLEAMKRGEETNSEIPEIFIRIMNQNGYELEVDIEKTANPRNHATVIRNLQNDAGEIYLIYGEGEFGEFGRSFMIFEETSPEYVMHCLTALFMAVLELEDNNKCWSFEGTMIRIMNQYEFPASFSNLEPSRRYNALFEGYILEFEYQDGERCSQLGSVL